MDDSSESSRRLCDNCTALDLSVDRFVVKVDAGHEVKYEKPIDLGKIFDIQQRSDCRLCCFVAQIIQESIAHHYAPASNSDGLDLNWNIRWKNYGHYIHHEEAVPQARCLEIYTSALSDTSNEYDSFCLYLLGDNAPSLLFYGRRIKKDQIDLSMVKKWRQSCQEWHGANCEEPILKGLSAPWSISNIRVVDVQQQCLVKMPHGCRYVTLSYVWGPEPTFTATKNNVKDLEQVGSLQTYVSELPATISDAIDLVNRLGERYLWVDKLCIVQDDLSNKQAQIWNMDRIYGHAILSITAGSGENADAGLPGVRLQSRNKAQEMAEVKPGMTLMNARCMKTLYAQVTYEQRTWTYQERFLSKRSLVFLAGQAFFHCRKASWSEDIVAEDPDVDSYELVLAGGPSTRPDHNPVISYASSIRDFTARDITYDWDILNAFAGISNYWAETLDANMKYGLPNSLFDWVILWESRQPLTRRRTDRQEFPSWS